jgi:hypothetical protein
VQLPEPDGGDEMLVLGMDAAAADEPEEVQRPAAALHAGAQLHERRQPEELARLDCPGDAHQVLRDDLAGAQVQVSHFAVADLSLGQAHGESRGVE